MPRWLKSLLGVLVGLGAVYAFLLRPTPQKEALLPKAPDPVIKFVLEERGTKLVFEKAEERWFLKEPVNALADPTLVDEFINGLKTLEGKEVLSRRPESHAQYVLTDAEGLRVSVWADPQASPTVWIFGKNATDYVSFYARVPGQNAVVRAEGMNRPSLENGAFPWRERRAVILAPAETLVSVRVQRGKSTMELKKSTEGWTVDGRPGDNQKIQAAVEYLQSASAVDFIDPPESLNLGKFGLDAPSFVFTVTSSAGRQGTIKVAAPRGPETVNATFLLDTGPSLLKIPASRTQPFESGPKVFFSKGKS